MSRIARWVVWLTTTVAVTYLVFVGGTFYGIETALGRITNLAIAFAFLVTWLCVALVKPRYRPRTNLGVAWLACAAVLVASTVSSTNPRASLETVGNAVLLGALYLLLTVLLRDEWFRRRLGSLALLLCVAISVGYLLQVTSAWVSWWTVDVRAIVPPPLRPGYVGLGFQAPIPIALMTVPLAAVGLASVSPGQRLRLVISGFVSILVGITILIVASRSVWFAAALALGVVLALTSRPDEHWRGIRRATSRRSLALVGAASLILIAIVSQSVISRVVGAGGLDLRSDFASVSLRIFASHPLVGSGPGTWAQLRSHATDPGQIDFWSPHAHSIYLQSLSELGTLGVIALAFLIWTVVGLIRSGLRDRSRRCMALAAAFVLVFALAEEAFGYAANLPAVVFAFGFPIAWLDATAPPQERDAAAISIWVPAIALVLLLVTTVGLGRVAAAGAQAEQAVVWLDEGDYRTARADIANAIENDSGVLLYSLIDGLAAAGSGDFVAARPLVAASATADDLAEAWIDLAYIDLEQGERSAATNDLNRAQRIGLQRASIAIPASWLWLKMGERDAAIDSLAAGLVSQPSLADDPQLLSGTDLATIRAAALVRAIERGDPRVKFELALRSGDIALAESVQSSLDPLASSAASLIVAGWRGDSSAMASLESLARREPLNGWVLGWSSRLAARNGDIATAARYEAWLNAIDPQSATEMARTSRINPAGASPLLLLWTVSSDYGYAVYRQQSPASLILPALPTLTRQ